jgi:hypothetical protein
MKAKILDFDAYEVTYCGLTVCDIVESDRWYPTLNYVAYKL